MPMAASLVQTPEISGSPHGVLDPVYGFAGAGAFAGDAGALCAWRAADARRHPVANNPARTGNRFFISTLSGSRGSRGSKVLRSAFYVLRFVCHSTIA
jgi:hypothetical protein